VVDIALITALHATGLTTPSAVAAVVLYRITTFKILGNLIWALHQRPHPRQIRLTAPPGPLRAAPTTHDAKPHPEATP
jgi:hypothetical protein